VKQSQNVRPDESYSVGNTGEYGRGAVLLVIADREDQAVQQPSLHKQQTQFASRMVWCMPQIS
jgi:hypothetical protein